ncbi:MAG: hypothetical protein GTO51_04385 [Candidatus Latescibacteria bacterium]|nr:hypothetical protein [Candidatus Latescibacterota bacterium]NIM21079.1 hypothetical protein [Candidatus Latescibacterota bacterium]NIM65214.1 hypothetical protein [Candidatus Latescibacterota bacterium]NIO01729.1 hypothetical protein [Candidatus Latescibacterota bacterium]NIO28246.1 hypothetical protein [Candidatus Latescibacterota bacterium]
MSGYLKGSVYKRFSKFIASVISGHAGVPITIVVFSVCAVLLLAYVTTQIYSSVLTERISNLEKQQLLYREKLHTLTSEITSLTSRERIVGYCEDRLGMIEADSESLKRVAIDSGYRPYQEHEEFTVRRSLVPEVLGYTIQKDSKKD